MMGDKRLFTLIALFPLTLYMKNLVLKLISMFISALCWIKVTSTTDGLITSCHHMLHTLGYPLDACKAKCLELDGNAINWSPNQNNCNVKLCPDPIDPQLTIGIGYEVHVYRGCKF